jgi:hypothetical protein
MGLPRETQGRQPIQLLDPRRVACANQAGCCQNRLSITQNVITPENPGLSTNPAETHDPPPRRKFQNGTTAVDLGSSTNPAARPRDELPVQSRQSVTKVDYPPPRRMFQNGTTPGDPGSTTNPAARTRDELPVPNRLSVTKPDYSPL